MSIYKKLLDIQKSIKGLGKDKNGNNYQYVTGSKVLEHIKPLMNDLGLILKQEIVSIENQRQDYTLKNGTNKSEILTKVMMKFTWIDTDTGEKDENLFGANGQNDWEKGLGSALTYAERYFLLKYFHIPTDSDDVDNFLRDGKIEDAIDEAETLDDLKKIYNELSEKDKKRFAKQVKEKRIVLEGKENALPQLTDGVMQKYINQSNEGKSIQLADLQKLFIITEEQKEILEQNNIL